FNPRFIPINAKAWNANTMERYFEVTLRRWSNGDVFGVEATIDHIQTTVGESVFFELFQPETKAFYLLREDIVTQAISLMKPADSGVYHTVNSSKEAIWRRTKISFLMFLRSRTAFAGY
ncbi:MAG: hypothetical protein ACKVGZ_00005, partial [Alphaproteobacteria bacterium]